MSMALKRLDAEWRRIAPSPSAHHALMRWRRKFPSLNGLSDFDELLARRREDPDTAQQLLAALAALSPGDEVAARVLLQALVPGLIRLSVTAGYDDDEAIDHLIALAWERIRTYPSTRHGDVAGNVLLDVRKRYRQHREIEAPVKRHQLASRFDSAAEDGEDVLAARVASVPSAEEVALQSLVLDQLVTAQRQGVISKPALGLILQTRLLDRTVSELADSSGISRNTLTSWRFRAERRLREFQLAG